MNSLQLRFWKWIRAKSEEKIRHHFLNERACDIKCVNCDTWYSLMWNEPEIVHTDYGYTMECDCCSHVSHWNAVAFPFPVVCDDRGNLIGTDCE